MRLKFGGTPRNPWLSALVHDISSQSFEYSKGGQKGLKHALRKVGEILEHLGHLGHWVDLGLRHWLSRGAQSGRDRGRNMLFQYSLYVFSLPTPPLPAPLLPCSHGVQCLAWCLLMESWRGASWRGVSNGRRRNGREAGNLPGGRVPRFCVSVCVYVYPHTHSPPFHMTHCVMCPT